MLVPVRGATLVPIRDSNDRMEAHAMSGWNQAPLPRDQILLFRETLGDRIPDNHSVRFFAEILDQLERRLFVLAMWL